jgi:hypothetical protein
MEKAEDYNPSDLFLKMSKRRPDVIAFASKVPERASDTWSSNVTTP